jgi:ubiquinone/menaquinone biosynthesis C-methylase UbiE
MTTQADIINEQSAARAFDKQSTIFDTIYSDNAIIQYKRQRVREHLLQFIKPSSKILELNAGTGEDAVYFAKQGYYVHATDISAGMQKILHQKTKEHKLEDKISAELRSFTDLANLNDKGPYDVIFSNFAGLNCTNQLDTVLQSFAPLLKNGGVICLVILPKFCLWETLLFFRGKFKTAFRRFFSKSGRKAHIEGQYFLCWYYNPSYVQKVLRREFDVLRIEGLCSLVPPSYMENFAEKYPRFFNLAKKFENKWKSMWPWRAIGDYYIISLRKKVNQ